MTETIKSKITLAALVGLILSANSLKAYEFHIANIGPEDLYVDIIFAAKGTGFIGDTGARDAWRLKGPQLVRAGETEEFKFVGVFCIHTIKLGASANAMVPAYLTKAADDQQAFDDTLATMTLVTNTVGEAAGKVPVIGDAAGLVLSALADTMTPFGSIFKNALCQDYTFYVSTNPYRKKGPVNEKYMTAAYLSDHIALAKTGLYPESKYKNIRSAVKEPGTWTNTEWWGRLQRSSFEPSLTVLKRAVTAAVQ